MKARHQLLGLGGFLLLSVAAGYLLGRFAPKPPQSSAPVASAPSRVPPPEAGRFYSVDNSDGGYRIIEVLGRSGDSIDVRLFGNHFSSRPIAVDETELTLDPADGYEGPGFDRLTVTPVMFATWKPEPVDHQAAHATASRPR